MAGMSEKHRNLLKYYRVALVKDLEPVKLLVDLLEVLDEEDVEVVKSENLRSRQAATLLDIICRRGPRAFDVFVSALEKKQPHLAKMLLKDSEVVIESSFEGEGSCFFFLEKSTIDQNSVLKMNRTSFDIGITRSSESSPF